MIDVKAFVLRKNYGINSYRYYFLFSFALPKETIMPKRGKEREPNPYLSFVTVFPSRFIKIVCFAVLYKFFIKRMISGSCCIHNND
jgi:hypothetical protein